MAEGRRAHPTSREAAGGRDLAAKHPQRRRRMKTVCRRSGAEKNDTMVYS